MNTLAHSLLFLSTRFSQITKHFARIAMVCPWRIMADVLGLRVCVAVRLAQFNERLELKYLS